MVVDIDERQAVQCGGECRWPGIRPADQDTICILISWPPAAAAKPSITVQFSIAVTSAPELGYKMRTFQLSDYYRLAFSHILYI